MVQGLFHLNVPPLPWRLTSCRCVVACAVLTIAHRIHTIADSDKIMVLSDGRVVEFAEPAVLLAQEDSVYRSLVEESQQGNQAP